MNLNNLCTRRCEPILFYIYFNNVFFIMSLLYFIHWKIDVTDNENGRQRQRLNRDNETETHKKRRRQIDRDIDKNR